jgi:acylphosphatase
VKAITAIIHGRVQGVWFRGSTQQKANELGITGWVKNTLEGNVELEAHGEKVQLEVFIAWLFKGPKYSQVEHVDVEWIGSNTQFYSFNIKH